MGTTEERVNFLFDYRSITEYECKQTDRNRSAFTYNQPIGAYEAGPTDDSTPESLFSKCVRLIIASFCYIIVICIFPISFPLCIRKVPALERLVIFRLGKIEKVKGPGFVLIMPCIDHWIKVDLHAQRFQTNTQQLLTRDGAILEIIVLVHYQIVDVVRSVMQVDKLDHVFKQLVHQCVNTAVTQRDEEDVTKGIHTLQRDLQDMLNKSTVAWGLEVMQVDIPPVQILKSGEPPNPVSTLMTAFNTALGGNTQAHSSVHPQSSTTQMMASPSSTSQDNVEDIEQAFCCLSEMVQTAMSQGTFQGQDGTVKLQVTDVNRNFYLVVKNGVGDLYEDLVGTAQSMPDVTLTLTSAVLVQMLRKRLSPMKAYSSGLVSVDGNWMLLQNFAHLVTGHH